MFKKISVIIVFFFAFALISCTQSEQNATDNSVNVNSANLQTNEKGENSGDENASPINENSAENSNSSDTNSTNADDNEKDSANGEKFKLIKSSHAEILAAWLKNKPKLSLAQVKEFPADALKRFREFKKDENAHPYYATGDFNNDEKEDFAVLLNNENTDESRSLAVFEAGSTEPDFFKEKMYKNFILSQDSEKKVLYISSFESDDGVILTPKGDSYELKPMLPE